MGTGGVVSSPCLAQMKRYRQVENLRAWSRGHRLCSVDTFFLVKTRSGLCFRHRVGLFLSVESWVLAVVLLANLAYRLGIVRKSVALHNPAVHIALSRAIPPSGQPEMHSSVPSQLSKSRFLVRKYLFYWGTLSSSCVFYPSVFM